MPAKPKDPRWAPGDYGIVVARASLEEQFQPDSINTQTSMGVGILDGLGLPLGDNGIYVDRISRSLWPRDVMDDVLDRIDDPHCRVVAAWASDRLYGDVQQQIVIWKALDESGTELHDIRGKFALNDETAQLLASLMALLAELEVRRTRRRVHDTHLIKFQGGKIVQKPPYGFRAVDGEFTIDQEELAIVRRVFHWMADDHLATADIAKRVAELGVRTSRGTAWSAVNIGRMIRNPWYAGEMVWNQRRTVWEGPKKRVVARPESEWARMPTPFGCVLDDDLVAGMDLYTRANARLERGAQVWARAGKKYRPRRFQGLMVCGRCGNRMYAFQRYRRNAAGDLPDTWEWRCAFNNQPGRRCAKSHQMSERKIVALLRAWVLESEVEGRQVPVRVEPDRTAAAEVRLLERHLAEAERVIKNSKRQLVAGRLSDEDYDELAGEQQASRDAAAARLDEIRARAAATPMAVQAHKARVRAALAPTFDALMDGTVGDAEEAGTVLRGLFKEIRVDNPTITIVI